MNELRTVRAAILRDIDGVVAELGAYASESDMWRTPGAVRNSAGTLALHLAGNLHHFVGALLGGDGYERDRPAEFADRNVPRDVLVGRLSAARDAVAEALAGDVELDAPFPGMPTDDDLSVGEFLHHLSTHLAYHLGQIDYHRRVVTGEPGAVPAMSIGALRRALDEA